ncbi:integral membrane protein S linking to the trans Golgi network-domain-containing protein [Papiliotrema laurentii]|uniref:Integral membrane protein S linking to the trans Golgi network-domain-containing protein n=1 Tax=Papiliotrema laurentii TaxID=5418 RepID=A0AAD9FWK0_PAPLA|nr:integral membrane protein S linking to the trans Golgi network-domain-containing protein [Papiliotrema laurentii]
MRVQGWDPVLLICQIISLQAMHYLTLSFIVPPLLTLTQPSLLTYSGGPNTVGHILDWREMAARPTISQSSFNGLLDFSASDSWKKLRGAWAGGKHIGEVVSDPSTESGLTGDPVPQAEPAHGEEHWDLGVDDFRAWLIAFAWIIASAVDIAPLYYLIRRPTYILDFSLTLTFIHLILTSYYAKSFPTSIFFWVVMASGAIMMIVVAEQLCVKREMRTELDLGWNPDDVNGEEIELGHVTR